MIKKLKVFNKKQNIPFFWSVLFMKRRRYIHFKAPKIQTTKSWVWIMIEMNSKFKVISLKNNPCFYSYIFLNTFLLRTIFVIILLSFLTLFFEERSLLSFYRLFKLFSFKNVLSLSFQRLFKLVFFKRS